MPQLTNFPTPPGRTNKSATAFPNDLVQGTREFYTRISFADYEYGLATGGSGSLTMGESVILPIPRKLNDVEVILWEEFSGTNAALGVAGNVAQSTGMLSGGWTSAAVAGIQAAAQGASIQQGATVNPFQFMMFRRPNFKEHTLQWQLAPNTKDESETLKKIINTMKKAALPSAYGGMFGNYLQKYPKIAMVQFRPNNYLYVIKPCAIISVQVDYTGSGGPSFFKSGAPTIVNLTLQLKEMQLWSQDNYEQ